MNNRWHPRAAAWAALALCGVAHALPVVPQASAPVLPPIDFAWGEPAMAAPPCGPAQSGEVAQPRRQGMVSLELAIAAAACRFPEVQRGAARQRQAQAEVALAQAAGRPSVSLSTGGDVERGSNLGWSSSVNLAWVLFDFGRNQAQWQQARHALAAATADQRTEHLAAVGEAVSRYAAAEAAMGRWEAAQISLRVAQEAVQVTRARQGEGASAMSDVVQAQAVLAQAQVDQLRAAGQWLTARGALAMAMGWAPQSALTLAPAATVDRVSAPTAFTIDTLMEEAMAQHPRMAAGRARLAQAQAQSQATQSERWGRVVVNASGGRSRPTYGQDTTATGSAQVVWSLPLYDGEGQQARHQSAQAGVLLAETALEEARREVALQVWQQAQALTSEIEVNRTSQRALENAQAALTAATERYRLGVGRFVELQTAQLALAAARLQRVESQAAVRREQQLLAVALGRLAPPGCIKAC